MKTSKIITLVTSLSFSLFMAEIPFAKANRYSQTITKNCQDSLSIEGYIATKNLSAKRTKEGLFYAVEQQGNGKTPKRGDYVKVKYVGKLLSEKIFDQSPENEPFIFQLGYRQVIEGWDLGLQNFTVGTKVKLFVPPHLGYGSTGAGEVVAPNTPLMFEIELLEILTPQAYDQHMKKLEAKERAEFEDKKARQFEVDQKLIADFVAAKKWKTTKTPSGLVYVLTKNGKGKIPQKGNTMSVHYEGTLLDGKGFDATKGRDPFSFTLGSGKVIEGFDEGLRFFAKGGEGYIIVPSKLGYGATPLDDGTTSIPANSVLVFKIQVIDIK